MEIGYEDIYSEKPYIDYDVEGARLLIHILYVPPALRGQGKGKALVEALLNDLPLCVQFIRLKSAQLGSGCTMAFWQSFGFTPAYLNGDKDVMCILEKGVNGHETPPVKTVTPDVECHYIFD